MAIDEMRVKMLLDKFPVDSPEWYFYRRTLDLLVELNLPITEKAAYAFMLTLEYANITMSDGRILGDDWKGIGSKEDISQCLAIAFADINIDPIWWKAGYVPNTWQTETIDLAKSLTRQLKQLPIVREVTSSLI